MHERLYLTWVGLLEADENDHSPVYWATTGDPDDVRTWLALLVALDGVVSRIEEALGRIDGHTPEDILIKIARCWDGLDGEDDSRVLRMALEVLFQRADALGGGE